MKICVMFLAFVSTCYGLEENDVYVDGKRIDDPEMKKKVLNDLSAQGLFPSIEAMTGPVTSGLAIPPGQAIPAPMLTGQGVPSVSTFGLPTPPYGLPVPPPTGHQYKIQHHVVLPHHGGYVYAPSGVPVPSVSPFSGAMGFGWPSSPGYTQAAQETGAFGPSVVEPKTGSTEGAGRERVIMTGAPLDQIFKEIGQHMDKLAKSGQLQPEKKGEEQETGYITFTALSGGGVATGLDLDDINRAFNTDIGPHEMLLTKEELECLGRKGCDACTHDFKCFFCAEKGICMPLTGYSQLLKGSYCPVSEIYYFETCKLKSLTVMFFIGIGVLCLLSLLFSIAFLALWRHNRRAH